MEEDRRDRLSEQDLQESSSPMLAAEGAIMNDRCAEHAVVRNAVRNILPAGRSKGKT